MIKKLIEKYKLAMLPNSAISRAGDYFIPIDYQPHFLLRELDSINHEFNYQQIEFSWFKWRFTRCWLGSSYPICDEL